MPTGYPGSGPRAKKTELAVTRLSDALAKANVDLAERLVQLNRAETKIKSAEYAAQALREHLNEQNGKVNHLAELNDHLCTSLMLAERRLNALLDLLYKVN